MKPLIQFSHANGFPAAVYKPFLDQIDADIEAIPIIGNAQYPVDKGFDVMADQLITEVEARPRNGQKVIGLGHSLGAVISLIAAGKRPDLFSEVILFDPVLFNPAKVLIIKFLQLIGQIDRFGPSGITLKRRDLFQSREEAAQRWRKRQPYSDLDPEIFKLVVEHCLVEKNGQYTLRIPARDEAEIFRIVVNSMRPVLRKVSGLNIFPTQSNFVGGFDRLCARFTLPHLQQLKPSGGHMLPLTHPREAAAMVNRKLSTTEKK